MADKPRRLGRGLEALLGSPNYDRNASARSWCRPHDRTSISSDPDPADPPESISTPQGVSRRRALAASGQPERNGLLQPITVRPAGNHFELIAGERRLRAATRLGWSEIPAIVKDYDDKALLTLALVENLQRADLNPIEEAEGYSRLSAEFALTQQEIAEVVGKDRSTVANSLRLLNLPTIVRRMLRTDNSL